MPWLRSRRQVAAVVTLIAAAMVLIGATAPAHAQSPGGTRVLVLPFSVRPDTPAERQAADGVWLGEAAAILITDELERLGVPAFPREERVAAFERLQLPQTVGLSRAMTIRIGELAGASHILIGEIRTGDTLSVVGRLVDLEAARQVLEHREDGPTADLYSVLDRLTAALASGTGRVLGPASDSPTRLPLEVFESYVKGLIGVSPVARQRLLETAYNRAPRDARVLLALWDAYSDQGEHAKALAAARSVPAGSPMLRRARFAAALSLIELKRWNEAFKTLNDLMGEQAAPSVANALGIVQLRRTGPPEGPSAVTFFRRAVTLAPEDPDHLFNLGYAAALARDTAAALNWLREVVRFDAADGDAHLVMSAVLASAARATEAQRELELARLLGTRHAIPAGPPRDRVPAGLERLDTDIHRGLARPAIGIASPAQRDQQAAAEFHVEQAKRLIDAQQDREAIDALRRAIYLSPYRDEPHLLLGRLYQKAGRLSQAIDEFKVAIWCRESVDARIALGAALLASGDRAAARTQIDRALVLAPGSQEAQALRRQID